MDAGSDTWFGLGPASRAMLATAGVHTPMQLKRADPVRLYLRVKATSPSASLNLLYALVGAQEGLPWQRIARERRTELLLALDALGAAPRRRKSSRRDQPTTRIDAPR